MIRPYAGQTKVSIVVILARFSSANDLKNRKTDRKSVLDVGRAFHFCFVQFLLFEIFSSLQILSEYGAVTTLGNTRRTGLGPSCELSLVQFQPALACAAKF